MEDVSCLSKWKRLGCQMVSFFCKLHYFCLFFFLYFVYVAILLAVPFVCLSLSPSSYFDLSLVIFSSSSSITSFSSSSISHDDAPPPPSLAFHSLPPSIFLLPLLIYLPAAPSPFPLFSITSPAHRYAQPKHWPRRHKYSYLDEGRQGGTEDKREGRGDGGGSEEWDW